MSNGLASFRPEEECADSEIDRSIEGWQSVSEVRQSSGAFLGYSDLDAFIQKLQFFVFDDFTAPGHAFTRRRRRYAQFFGEAVLEK
jgi:hypothetical protein